MKKSFKVGEIVRLKTAKGKFRYVKNNVVRSVETGRVKSVKSSDICKCNLFWKFINNIKTIFT